MKIISIGLSWTNPIGSLTEVTNDCDTDSVDVNRNPRVPRVAYCANNKRILTDVRLTSSDSLRIQPESHGAYCKNSKTRFNA